MKTNEIEFSLKKVRRFFLTKNESMPIEKLKKKFVSYFNRTAIKKKIV